jgi:hypothetical protein
MASENRKSVKLRLCINLFLKLCVTLWLMIFIVSCQTMPKAPDVFQEEARFAPLDTGASVYIFANVKEARSIINLLPVEELKDRQAVQMLDRSNYIAAAFFPPQSGRRFQLVAWGNFPGTGAGMAFSFDRNWQQQRSATGGSFWHSSVNRLSISMNSKQAFVADSLNDTPVDPLTSPPGTEIPEGFNAFRHGTQRVPGISGTGDTGTTAPLSFWLENPGPIIQQLLNEAGLPLRFPVQKLFINLFVINETPERYEAIIRFQFENASHARGMAAILNLAGGFTADNPLTSILFANPPVQEGLNVDIKSAPLNDAELLNLLSLFSLF